MNLIRNHASINWFSKDFWQRLYVVILGKVKCPDGSSKASLHYKLKKRCKRI